MSIASDLKSKVKGLPFVVCFSILDSDAVKRDLSETSVFEYLDGSKIYLTYLGDNNPSSEYTVRLNPPKNEQTELNYSSDVAMKYNSDVTINEFTLNRLEQVTKALKCNEIRIALVRDMISFNVYRDGEHVLLRNFRDDQELKSFADGFLLAFNTAV